MQHNRKCIIFSRVVPTENKTGATEYSTQLIEFISSIFTSTTVVVSSNYSNFKGSNLSKFTENVNFIMYERKQYKRINWALSEYPSSTEKMIPKEEYEHIESLIKANSDSLFIVDQIGSGWVLKYLKKYGIQKIIYVSHNQEYSVRINLSNAYRFNLFMKLIHLIDALKAWKLENNLIKYCNYVSCITAEDLEKFKHIYKKGSFVVFNPKLHRKNIIEDKSFGSRSICILGSYLWESKKINLNNFLDCCSVELIKNNISINVVGNMEKKYLEKMKKKWGNINFTGYVDDFKPHLVNSDIGLIIEEVGGGFKMKTLDYISNRVPIFALEEGTAGTFFENKVSAMISKDLNELTTSIIENISNKELLASLSHNAIKSIEDKKFNYEFSNVLTKIFDNE